MIDFPRYLSAKKTVDDRALNRGVWEKLRAEIAALHLNRPLRILELGCGIGTLVERQIEAGLADWVEYLGLDEQVENIEAASNRLAAWGRDHAVDVAASPEGLRVRRANLNWQIRFQSADVTDFQLESGPFDLIIAQAFLDLIDVPRFLPILKSWLAPGGLFYFTINFDGETIFEPVSDPGREQRLVAAYHRTMDERRIAGQLSGDSRAGRHLFAQLRAAGAQILAAGSSDWVVYSTVDGRYPADEAYFLACILAFFENSLSARPDVDQAELAAWLAERRRQIDTGKLVYIAHQLDFVGCF